MPVQTSSKKEKSALVCVIISIHIYTRTSEKKERVVFRVDVMLRKKTLNLAVAMRLQEAKREYTYNVVHDYAYKYTYARFVHFSILYFSRLLFKRCLFFLSFPKARYTFISLFLYNGL